MKGQMTFRQYRRLDLCLFLVMAVAFEGIAATAAVKWFPGQPYTVSIAAAVTAIVMVRWGPWAALHAAAAGISFCLCSGADARQFLIYGGGNLLSLGALALVRAVGWEKLRRDALTALLYGFLTQLLMHLGRALLSLLFGASLSAAAGFFATDVVSYLFTMVLVWIARQMDGLMEDQRHYLLRVSREKEEE